ncbi:hypothetical protein THAR02_06856 [Trichoderma harzianum]|uniref:Cyclase n=1 Tax=Trichoderma harzianum TaxID=5544 RepID=A0A0G0A7G3_TRIHA|nr:hypothetical protein THAR02_06856 [Trichoderma harzianum]
MMDNHHLPSWKSMPAVPGMPHGCAWGLFDRNNVKDEVGTINLLQPSTIVNASKEIKTGKSVILNWPLDRVHEPSFDRPNLHVTVKDWKKEGGPWYCYDDEIKLNTQSGSQWDGLRHWGHSVTGMYYNGIPHESLLDTSHLGVEHWSKRGGIVGRGVLLDYVAFAARHNIEYDPVTRHCITLSDILKIAEEQSVTFQRGDILIFRTGWVKWYEEHTEEERRSKIKNGNDHVGIEGNEEMFAWLWDNHFAALAGDTVGVEAWPPTFPWCLHDYAISMWGMPLGELWDLEALATACEEENRWTFFFTSAPLNNPGGIASPPNAVAVF